MTCRDFERMWNELLDSETVTDCAAGSAGAAVRDMAECERVLREHAAGCAACSQVNARYQVLRRAIRAWGPPIAPSTGLADRILAEIQAPTTTAWAESRSVGRKRLWPIAAALAATAAAAILVAIALPALNRSLDRRLQDGHPIVLHNTPVAPDRDTATIAGDSRALNMALAEATAATWDLARSASEPAARISREVLDAATGPDQPGAVDAAVTGSDSVAATVSVPSLDSLVPGPAAAGAMLQQVGDRLSHGVRPLSDTARHAFGFLIGTTLTKPEASINPPAQKGA
jgi:hypothetical protein